MLCELPDLVLEIICSFLNVGDLTRLLRTSKDVNQIVQPHLYIPNSFPWRVKRSLQNINKIPYHFCTFSNFVTYSSRCINHGFLFQSHTILTTFQENDDVRFSFCFHLRFICGLKKCIKFDFEVSKSDFTLSSVEEIVEEMRQYVHSNRILIVMPKLAIIFKVPSFKSQIIRTDTFYNFFKDGRFGYSVFKYGTPKRGVICSQKHVWGGFDIENMNFTFYKNFQISTALSKYISGSYHFVLSNGVRFVLLCDKNETYLLIDCEKQCISIQQMPENYVHNRHNVLFLCKSQLYLIAHCQFWITVYLLNDNKCIFVLKTRRISFKCVYCPIFNKIFTF